MIRELLLPKTLGSNQARDGFEIWSSVADVPSHALRLPAGASLRASGVVLLAAALAERRRATSPTASADTVHASAPWRGSWICLDAPLEPL